MDFTVPRIRAFFSLNTRKMKQAIATLEIAPGKKEKAENAIVAEKMKDETLSMEDLKNEETET